MNLDKVYVGENLYANVDKEAIMAASDITVTLAPGSGVFANIADFADNFNTMVSYFGKNIEITTATVENPTHLAAMYTAIRDLEAAGGSSGTQAVVLTTTYGYALDLAFRCNASESDLLLQTGSVQRVYDDSSSAATLGGGSYMEFSSSDNALSITQIIQLMDAVRVAFVDSTGNLLGVAKLNTSNRQTIDGAVRAALYLYDYSFSQEDGSMVMGERRKSDNTITSLQKNVAKAVTVLVWLDGDVVDNTMVSAESDTSLTGMLNLQFASSADLIPAENGQYRTLTTDRTGLVAMLAAQKETYDAGQMTYTTVSWNTFSAAYNYAVSVANDASATDPQIRNAATELSVAAADLDIVSKDSLDSEISEYRDIMGQTDEVARYIVQNTDGSYNAISEYTEEQEDKKKGTLNDVNIENNLRDEGNDIQTPIYTQESWNNLASALYHAEAVSADPNATDEQINAAMTALDDAYKGLEHGAYFIPYDYQGTLYYYAKPQDPNDDTYGKWYTADFKRIVSDLTILNLDAHAELTNVAEITVGDYTTWDTDTITPYITLLDDIYPSMKSEQVIGINWDAIDEDLFVENASARHTAALNELIKKVQNNDLEVDITEAQRMLDYEADGMIITAAAAETEIKRLTPLVDAAMAAKEAEEAAKAEESNPCMTAAQRQVLTHGVSLAKSVEGYDDTDPDMPDATTDPEGYAEAKEQKERLDALRDAVAEAEAILETTDTTKEAAATAINTLNVQLEANGQEIATEYNSVVYNIPVASETYEIVYATEYPGLTLGLTGKTGNATLGLVGVTRNGVVLVAQKEIQVYTKASDVTITDSDGGYGPFKVTSGDTLNLVTDLSYVGFTDKEINLGNITMSDNDIMIAYGELIKSVTWASSNTSIATVSDGTIVAGKAGTVTISVSVKTHQGNVYRCDTTVTVEAAE